MITPEEWRAKVAEAEARWAAAVNNVTPAEWQAAMIEVAERVRRQQSAPWYRRGWYRVRGAARILFRG